MNQPQKKHSVYVPNSAMRIIRRYCENIIIAHFPKKNGQEQAELTEEMLRDLFKNNKVIQGDHENN